MRKTLFLIIALVMCGAIAAFAAPGKLVVDPNGNAIQAHSPYPAASTCTTTTTTGGAGRANIATISTVAGYSSLCWEASDNTNAAKRIKQYLNSNTAYLPSTGRCIALNSDITSVSFRNFSAASTSYTVCYELQRGGKTP